MMTHTCSHNTIRLSFLVLLLAISSMTRATSVIPMNIEQITERAALIIHGTVNHQEVRYDDISKRNVTLTHFDVIETLKGDAGKTHTIKQIGGQLPGQTLIHQIHGVPRFINGEEYVVFLPGTSRLGFSSPVGLAQGQFEIALIDGVATIRDNRGSLTADSSSAAGRVAAKPVKANSNRLLSLEQFKADIRERSGDQ